MTAEALVEAEDLRVEFRPRGGRSPRRRILRAVDGVTLAVARCETVGLVGESGSGKSTLARAMLRLLPVRGGRVRYAGTDITHLPERRLRDIRRRTHLVFQDPYSSLDPSMVVEDLVAEPLDVHEQVSRLQRRERVIASLERVGLHREHLVRYPHEFSGGQRQRIAIARGLILDPEFMACDEPVSALDVSTRSQIVNLLRDLQEALGLSYLFVAHDLTIVRHISDRVAIMYLGQIVEEGPAERVYQAPAHPYTAALISAIPVPDPAVQRGRERIRAAGDPPSPLDPPSGCRFRTRCPYVMDVCHDVAPEPVPVPSGGIVRCHLHTSGPALAGDTVLRLERVRAGGP